MKHVLSIAAVLALTAACAGDDAMMSDDMSASAETSASTAARTSTSTQASAQPRASAAASAQTSAQRPITPSESMESNETAMMAQRQQTEAALRQLITGLQSGNVDYNSMLPHLADAMRGQQAAMTARMQPRGAIRSIEYLDTEANGNMRFRVTYENESSIWGLQLDNQGKISGLAVTD